MSDRTPTTEECRTAYSLMWNEESKPDAEARADFDAWLGQVRADAWEQGARMALHSIEVFGNLTNPYRRPQ